MWTGYYKDSPRCESLFPVIWRKSSSINSTRIVFFLNAILNFCLKKRNRENIWIIEGFGVGWSFFIFYFLFFFLITWGKSWEKISKILLHIEILIRKLCVYNLGLTFTNRIYWNSVEYLGHHWSLNKKDKQILKVYFSEFCWFYFCFHTDANTTTRICANDITPHFSNECHRYTTVDGTSTRCYCDTDLCNMAGRTVTPSRVGLIVATAVIYKLIGQFHWQL